MKVSARYAPALVALFTLTAVPVVVHTYLEVEIEDCARPLEFPRKNSYEDPETVHFMSRALGASAWRTGTLPRRGDAPPLSYAIVRSFDPKRVYYRAAGRVPRRLAPEARVIDWIEEGGERLPVHRAVYKVSGREPVSVASYLLAYRGEPVADPYRAQLLASPLLLFTGTRPMTIMIAWGAAAPAQRAAADQSAERWLRSAWRDYRSSCSPGVQSTSAR